MRRCRLVWESFRKRFLGLMGIRIYEGVKDCFFVGIGGDEDFLFVFGFCLRW